MAPFVYTSSQPWSRIHVLRLSVCAHLCSLNIYNMGNRSVRATKVSEDFEVQSPGYTLSAVKTLQTGNSHYIRHIFGSPRISFLLLICSPLFAGSSSSPYRSHLLASCTCCGVCRTRLKNPGPNKARTSVQVLWKGEKIPEVQDLLASQI